MQMVGMVIGYSLSQQRIYSLLHSHIKRQRGHDNWIRILLAVLIRISKRSYLHGGRVDRLA